MRDPQAFHFHARRRRALGAVGLVGAALTVLVLTCFHTQVMRSPVYAMQSDRNRLRPLTLPAPRGTILDRHGRILAENVPGYALSLLPGPADSVRATLERLRPFLGLTAERVDALMARRARGPQQSLVVSTDLSFDRVSAIEERRPLFSQVLVEMQPKRHYPLGPAAAHVLGYVGEISERELADSAFSRYRPGRVIGKTGLERRYESRLAGVPGVRYIEVDARGRVLGDWAFGDVAPVPGRPLRLTLDRDLQRWVAEIVPDTARGGVVALKPGSGEILAFYSSPSFDPNVLAGAVDPARWRALRQDSARRLLNRPIAGIYPPGSTWKLATAAIGLELGIVDPQASMPLSCRGGMRYGNRYFRCWDRSGHGPLDLAGAIKNSCNVYFYQLGLQIGLERLLSEGIRLGFNDRTGVDMPSEKAGRFPPSPGWYERRFGWAPTEAEVLSLAIGQGANEQTVLKMAQFFSAIATDGKAPPPRLALEPAPRPASTGSVRAGEAARDAAGRGEGLDLRVGAGTLQWLREGLRQVTEPGGTAGGSALEHWDWMGKTGTSQNPHGKDHGWFVGIAGPRGGAPEVVVAALIEQGEHGSDVAQIAAKAADYYLRKQRDMPIDTIQTLREHWQAGVPAPWASWD